MRRIVRRSECIIGRSGKQHGRVHVVRRRMGQCRICTPVTTTAARAMRRALRPTRYVALDHIPARRAPWHMRSELLAGAFRNDEELFHTPER
jgi:hypothetical protein